MGFSTAARSPSRALALLVSPDPSCAQERSEATYLALAATQLSRAAHLYYSTTSVTDRAGPTMHSHRPRIPSTLVTRVVALTCHVRTQVRSNAQPPVNSRSERDSRVEHGRSCRCAVLLERVPSGADGARPRGSLLPSPPPSPSYPCALAFSLSSMSFLCSFLSSLVCQFISFCLSHPFSPSTSLLPSTKVHICLLVASILSLRCPPFARLGRR